MFGGMYFGQSYFAGNGTFVLPVRPDSYWKPRIKKILPTKGLQPAIKLIRN